MSFPHSMKRPIILLLLTIILSAMSAPASEPKKGYRGFVDLNGQALFQKKYSDDYDIVHSNFGFTTTHGYQLDKHFFVGAGTGILATTFNYHRFALGLNIPVYAAGRIDWNIKKVPLFADLVLGSFIGIGNNMYVTPSLGYHCSWGRKVSMNIGVGVSWHWYNHYYDYHGYRCKPMPSVKLGIDFN